MGRRAADCLAGQPNGLGSKVRAWLCQSVLKDTQHIRPWGTRVLWAAHLAGGKVSTAPTSFQGTGNLGVLPKLLSSFRLPWMGLEDPLPGMLGSLAESHPFPDLFLQSAQSHRELEAAARPNAGRRGAPQDKGTWPETK